MAKHRLTFFDRVYRADHDKHKAWLTWVNDPGTNNLQDVFEGGEPASIPYAIVDLSAVASYQLGRQVPQSAKYILRGVTISYRPQDDNLLTAENEDEGFFSGKLKWYADTDHGREALSLARQVEQHQEKGAVDLDSFLLSTDKDYSAMRFSWSDDGDVLYPTQCFTFGAGVWTLGALESVYNSMTEPCQSNALFNGRFPGRQAIGWTATFSAGRGDQNHAQVNNNPDFHKEGLYHEILAGLLSCTVEHSSIRQWAEDGVFDMFADDLQWYIGLDYEVIV